MFKLINLQMYKLLIFHFQNHDVFHMLLLKSIKDDFINSLSLILVNDIEK